jgi:superfamily I DNA/RNA helicase
MMEGSARMVRLTAEQAWVMEALLENRRLRVVGGAGTGKTLLALEAARRLAEGGVRTLLLCFNRALAAYLEGEVTAWDAGKARAACFHDLCREAAAELGVPFEEPRDPAARPVFYNQEAPSVLTLGLQRGCALRWDAVVVDEGQDFDASWWPLVESLLSEPASGFLYVFYDPPQAIFGRRPAVPEVYPVLRLRRNLRNARPIAEALASLAGGELWPDERGPEGAPVQVHEAGPESERAGRVEAVVRELLRAEGLRPDQIVLLTPHRFEHGSLAGREELAGVPLGRDPAAREGKLLHATISGFKGLESDCVILLDLDPADPRCDRNARYVGASRARHLLHVFWPESSKEPFCGS